MTQSILMLRVVRLGHSINFFGAFFSGLHCAAPAPQSIPSNDLCPILYADRKSTRLNSRHQIISYAVFCLKKKNRRNTFNSKWPLAPPKFTATSLPNTCAHSIVIALDWVGFTLPGMIELSCFFF